MKIKKQFAVAALLVTTQANAILVDYVKVTQLYVQSQNGSAAHAVRVNKDIDGSCAGRLYIEFSDKELVSTLLAYKIADIEFDIMYATGQPSKSISGHLSASCRLFSVF
jgi:hypothetical protein